MFSPSLLPSMRGRKHESSSMLRDDRPHIREFITTFVAEYKLEWYLDTILNIFLYLFGVRNCIVIRLLQLRRRHGVRPVWYCTFGLSRPKIISICTVSTKCQHPQLETYFSILSGINQPYYSYRKPRNDVFREK